MAAKPTTRRVSCMMAAVWILAWTQCGPPATLLGFALLAGGMPASMRASRIGLATPRPIEP
jgi:hypothetical protein